MVVTPVIVPRRSPARRLLAPSFTGKKKKDQRKTSLDSVVAAARDVSKKIVLPIKRQFGYLISSKSFDRALWNEVIKLEYAVEIVRDKASVARNNGREVLGEVTEWLESAVEVLKEAKELLEDFEKASKTRSYGTLLPTKRRYQFSRKARDMIEVIRRLAKEYSQFKDITFSGPAPEDVAAPAPADRKGKRVVLSTTATSSTSSALMSIKIGHDGVIESRATIIRNIMDALADNSNSVVGVHWMGGAGESTLLEDAVTRIRTEKLFDLVAKADVSANPDIKRIQGEIACLLGLDLKDDEHENVRADRLRDRLENEKKKVLIILDNLWKGLDLKSVGIPSGHYNKVIGCKLLLTSRDPDVLRREMGCDRDFFLGGLQEEEAEELFGGMVGNKVYDDEFKPLADDVLHQGAGTYDVSSRIEPPHSAEELERCSNDVESSPPEHSRKVLMCGGLGLTEPLEVTRWQSFTEIYFMENQLTELPENPQCPVLSVLFLNRNCNLRNISPTFFDFMPALEILNLSRTRIKSLPESLFRLSCLKRLFLNHCELLRVLPQKIGELQQLEVLDLEGTEIMDLPKEVAKLTKLTCLEVSFCPRTNCGTKSAKANALIPQRTISALSQLEELSIDIHPEDEGWESVVEAIIDDVCGLMRLNTLKLYFPQVEHLRKWFGMSKVSRSLSHFKFVVGKDAERIMSYLPESLEFELECWDRSLKYVNGVGVPIDIQKMLLHTTAFFLDRHWDVTYFSDFGIENMEQLKCCMIGECNEVQIIVDGTHMYDKADRSEIILETQEDDRRFLGSLEYLYIYRMKSLRCIYEGPLHRGSLSHLKCLALLTCPQLTSIFTTGLLENLDSLEELNVEDCPLLLSLVSCEDTSIYSRNCFLPKLKRISLVSLPELSSISSGLRIAPNLERLSIFDCPNLESPSADEICCSHMIGAKGGPALTISCSSSSEDGLSRSMGGRSNEPIPKVDIAPNSEARVFRLAELKVATRNFRPDMILGEHDFGKVFKGYLDKKGSSQSGEKTPIAIKMLDAGSMPGFGEWKSTLDFLGRLSHPNIVKLMGYCLEAKILLVYEFVPNGSLEDHLFAKDSAIQPLPWVTRLKIAVGAARGLAFLHQLETPIIYTNFKPSNILLDSSYNAKITDFGPARKYGSHVSTRVMGTVGYAAPEYIATGHLSMKSDVYSFGVVLVQLLTGMRARDANRPTGQQILVEWVKPHLSKRNLTKIMDLRLGGRYPLKDALDVAKLAFQCLDSSPKRRPSMEKVVQTLNRISCS